MRTEKIPFSFRDAQTKLVFDALSDEKTALLFFFKAAHKTRAAVKRAFRKVWRVLARTEEL